MIFSKPGKSSFFGVGILFILFGSVIFAFSLVGWLSSAAGNDILIHAPFTKVIGGAIIIALGYILVELELIRRNK